MTRFQRHVGDLQTT